jgi:hypothetical protein
MANAKKARDNAQDAPVGESPERDLSPAPSKPASRSTERGGPSTDNGSTGQRDSYPGVTPEQFSALKDRCQSAVNAEGFGFGRAVGISIAVATELSRLATSGTESTASDAGSIREEVNSIWTQKASEYGRASNP